MANVTAKPQHPVIVPIRALSPRAQLLASTSKAVNTHRAYDSDWRNWAVWCARTGRDPSSATGVDLANYIALSVEAGLSLSTIKRRRSAVVHETRLRYRAEINTADVKQVIAGASRLLPVDQHQAAPLTAELLASVLRALAHAGTAGVRDRALLSLGWQGALRESELTGLQWGDWQATVGGHVLRLRHTKSARSAEVFIIAAADSQYCPIEAMARWRRVSRPRSPSTPVFRAISRGGHIWRRGCLSAGVVSDIVRRAVMRAGGDPSGYSSHSLRRGFLTSAAAAGVDVWRLREHSSIGRRGLLIRTCVASAR